MQFATVARTTPVAALRRSRESGIKNPFSGDPTQGPGFNFTNRLPTSIESVAAGCVLRIAKLDVRKFTGLPRTLSRRVLFPLERHDKYLELAAASLLLLRTMFLLFRMTLVRLSHARAALSTPPAKESAYCTVTW